MCESIGTFIKAEFNDKNLIITTKSNQKIMFD